MAKLFYFLFILILILFGIWSVKPSKKEKNITLKSIDEEINKIKKKIDDILVDSTANMQLKKEEITALREALLKAEQLKSKLQ